MGLLYIKNSDELHMVITDRHLHPLSEDIIVGKYNDDYCSSKDRNEYYNEEINLHSFKTKPIIGAVSLTDFIVSWNDGKIHYTQKFTTSDIKDDLELNVLSTVNKIELLQPYMVVGK